MSDKIASKEETKLRLIMLQSAVKYMKENHITEKSKNGQMLNTFEQYMENTVVNALLDPDKK